MTILLENIRAVNELMSSNSNIGLDAADRNYIKSSTECIFKSIQFMYRFNSIRFAPIPKYFIHETNIDEIRFCINHHKNC